MNSEGNAVAGQQGQQQQPMQRMNNIFIRAEQIQNLPHLDQQHKQKLEQFVKNMYSKLASRPTESEEYKLAYKGLHEVTLKLRQDINAWNAKRAAQQGGPQSRTVAADQQLQRPKSQSGLTGSVQQQQQPQQQTIIASVFQHVQNYDFSLPPEVSPDSPEGEKALSGLKSSYLGLLTKKEQAASQVKQLKALIDQRKAQGLEIPPEVMARKSQADSKCNQMMIYDDDFRRKQLAWRRERQNRQQQQTGGSNGSDAKRDNSIQSGNGQQHNQQQSRNQQGQGQRTAVQSLPPNPDTGDNARNRSNINQDSISTNSTSVEQQQHPLQHQIPSQQQRGQKPEQLNSVQQGQPQTRRVQQMPGQEGTFQAESSQNTSSVQISSQQQRQQASDPQQRAFTQGQQPAFSNGQLQSPKIVSASATSLIGHPSHAQSQQQQEPQSAMSGTGPLGSNTGTNGTNAASVAGAGAGGPPFVLTQSAALSAAARQYTDSRGGINVSSGGSSYLQLGNSEQNTNPKMPITQKLNVSTPQPVAMGPARPTMAGPTNGGPIGVMGQPAIPKTPGFVLEGDGDRVLSKKKLDELVRQVTGSGTIGPSGVEVGTGDGEGLSPEVENAILQLADDFVDSVITSACRLAKLRNSATLDIRDLQLILERNYNIRIPGYASDEVRTVRKFNPAQGWTQKMNAVQAAKVMGGGAKGDV